MLNKIITARCAETNIARSISQRHFSFFVSVVIEKTKRLTSADTIAMDFYAAKICKVHVHCHRQKRKLSTNFTLAPIPMLAKKCILPHPNIIHFSYSFAECKTTKKTVVRDMSLHFLKNLIFVKHFPFANYLLLTLCGYHKFPFLHFCLMSRSFHFTQKGNPPASELYATNE